MQLLLDSHAIYWWMRGDPQLSETARQAIEAEDSGPMFSPVNVYELAYKAARGKLALPPGVAGTLAVRLTDSGLTELPITALHAEHAAVLAISHRDPIDRMLIAQALVENLALVSNEKLFDATGVRRLWD
jgi:PIN domain nuclease of toxin-antitoxin system